MGITRRRLLKLGLLGAAGLALPRRHVSADAMPRSPAIARFAAPLPIPPVLRPARRGANTDYYEVTQREGALEIVPGLTTAVWGYNGAFPGPTVEAQRGRKAVIRQTNALPVPVSTHLHGGVVPPDSDGYPTDLIRPGSFKDYTYPNQQRAATLWYHDHRMDFTGPQVYRGLVGLYIVHDDIEEALPLPKGDCDIPLIITDRIVSEDGALWYPSIDPSLTGHPGVRPEFMTGVEGDTILVNGAPWPFLDVSNTRYRFRILNASNARRYELALDPPSGPAPFVQIGSDGGLLEAPLPHGTIAVAPGERFDVVVDFGLFPIGSYVTMKNLRGEGPVADVMRFVVARRARDDSRIPERLAPVEPLPDPADAVVSRHFQFFNAPFGGMATINQLPFDPDRIDARPRFDSTEIWKLEADFGHPIHLHGLHFRVLTRNDGPPGPFDGGWKDTVFVPGGGLELIARFSGYRGKYVFHCHNLEHEDMAMMANFEVI